LMADGSQPETGLTILRDLLPHVDL
jgi:hypothetical protein